DPFGIAANLLNHLSLGDDLSFESIIYLDTFLFGEEIFLFEKCQELHGRQNTKSDGMRVVVSWWFLAMRGCFGEGYFIAPVYSIYFNQSERYEWEAVEACRVKVVSYETFLDLEERYPKLTRVLLDFAIHMLDLFSQKLNLLQFQTAYDRYHLFLEMYPNLHNRVSLGSIASFLGVTQQTLSVIRGKKK
ncbi:MAG: hypothetical protein AAFQ87_15800, partial [Bacteroidota bacterium]